MQVLIGTSGFAYKEWKGIFYPPDIKPAAMLSFYAERFPTVELNNTFYRMPKRDLLESWAADVPDGFRFTIKASRRITHIARLRDCAGAVAYLWDAAGALGGKLGPFLFQLPPTMKKDLDRLRAFLAALPAELQAAFEFRHESWASDDVRDALRARNAALCTADVEEDPDDAPIAPTADWGYLRLRRCAYDDAGLAAWRDRILAQPWREAYVYFKHEDEGTGPELGARFGRLLVTEPRP